MIDPVVSGGKVIRTMLLYMSERGKFSSVNRMIQTLDMKLHA